MNKLITLALVSIISSSLIAMEHNPQPIVRVHIVSVYNKTNKDLKFVAPNNSTLEVRSGQLMVLKKPLNIEPNNIIRRTLIVDTYLNKPIGFIEPSLATTREFMPTEQFKIILTFLKPGTIIPKPVVTKENKYPSREFRQGYESWDFNISLILDGQALENSEIKIDREVKETR